MESMFADAFDVLIIRDWLNSVVDNHEQGKVLAELNTQIKAVPPVNFIQIYSGIEIMADVLGEELGEDEWDDEYRERFFYYRGVKIMQLMEKAVGHKEKNL